jgi:hypothetical protein
VLIQAAKNNRMYWEMVSHNLVSLHVDLYLGPHNVHTRLVGWKHNENMHRNLNQKLHLACYFHFAIGTNSFIHSYQRFWYNKLKLLIILLVFEYVKLQSPYLHTSCRPWA